MSEFSELENERAKWIKYNTKHAKTIVMQHFLNSNEIEENKDMECCGNCLYYAPNKSYVGEGWCCIGTPPFSNLKNAKSYDIKCRYFVLGSF